MVPAPKPSSTTLQQLSISDGSGSIVTFEDDGSQGEVASLAWTAILQPGSFGAVTPGSRK